MKTKIKMICFILLLTFLLSSSFVAKSYATFWDGNDLVKYMREYEKVDKENRDTDFLMASQFVGYVIGVSDVYSSMLNKKMPDGIEVKQICAIVAKFLKEHPEQWNFYASFLILQALEKAFERPAK